MILGKLNIVAIILVLAYGSIFATDYYVDNAAVGSSNVGTLANPFTSHTMVNNMTFQPGDNIFLKSGNTYNYSAGSKCRVGGLPGRLSTACAVISPLGAGNPTSPITISIYGGTVKPVINAQGIDYSAGILLVNQDNWVIKNLEIENTNAGTGMIFRWGIMVFFTRPSLGGTLVTKKNITISNNFVHDVFASNLRESSMYFSGGIFVLVDADVTTSYNSNSPANQYIDGVTIEDNKVENITGEGIRFIGEETNVDNPALDVMNWNNLSKNIVIRRNSTKNTCDGIMVSGADNPIMEYNIVDNAGGTGKNGTDATSTKSVCGLWTFGTRDGIVQYNEVMNTKSLPGDGIGLHHDVVHSGTAIFQYNYSHDNAGGFISGFWPWTGDEGTPKVVWRYNVSLNDHSTNVNNTSIYLAQGKTEIYNNTVYSKDPFNINYFPNNSLPQPPNMVYVANNIFYSTTGNAVFTNNSQVKYENNLYSNNIQSNLANDSKAIYSNLIFENPGSIPNGISNITGYTLKINSPGIDKGILILNNGNKAFGGASIFGIPDIGAFEKFKIVPTILTPLLLN